MNNKKVGEMIAILRKKRGLTGEALAELIHVTPQAISKWENGRCLPETAILPSLAQALGCRVDDILMEPEIVLKSFEEIVNIEAEKTKNILQQFDPVTIVKASMGASPHVNRYLKALFPEIDFIQLRIRIGSVRVNEIEDIHCKIIRLLNQAH